MQNRKQFIQLAGTAAAGIALTGLSGFSLPGCDIANTAGPFGIQLYTLRDDMPKDPKGVLKQLASFGYKQIESYEGDKGMFWGMSPAEFKKYMDELGMTIVSSHMEMNKDFEKKVVDAASIGMKYLICPWVGPKPNIDEFKKLAATFNEKGEICRKHGIRFAYHNHDYSFKEVNGQMPQKVMMDETDPALVDFELDIYWVVTAGKDPIKWLDQYPNRFRLCHVKDRNKNPGKDNGQNSVDIGTGSIDFAKILRHAKEKGMQYNIVEQEYYQGSTPLKSAEAGAKYMKTLQIG